MNKLKKAAKNRNLLKCKQYFDLLIANQSLIDATTKSRMIKLYASFNQLHTHQQLWTSIDRIATVLYHISLS